MGILHRIHIECCVNHEFFICGFPFTFLSFYSPAWKEQNHQTSKNCMLRTKWQSVISYKPIQSDNMNHQIWKFPLFSTYSYFFCIVYSLPLLCLSLNNKTYHFIVSILLCLGIFFLFCIIFVFPLLSFMIECFPVSFETDFLLNFSFCCCLYCFLLAFDNNPVKWHWSCELKRRRNKFLFFSLVSRQFFAYILDKTWRTIYIYI